MRRFDQSAAGQVAAGSRIAKSERARVGLVAHVLGIASVLGCTDMDGLPVQASQVSRLAFAELEFVEVGQVVLRQTESSSLVSVDNLDMRDDGLLLITDRDQPAVLLFDSSGTPIPMSSPRRSTGRAAPYESPYDAVFLDRNRIAVSDFPPRIVVLNMADHSVDFSFPLDQEIWSPRLHAHDSVFIVEKTDTHAPGAAFFEYSFDGSIVRAFHHHVQHVLDLPAYLGISRIPSPPCHCAEPLLCSVFDVLPDASLQHADPLRYRVWDSTSVLSPPQEAEKRGVYRCRTSISVVS